MVDSASSSDWDPDDVDWDPKLKKIYYDDSWATGEPEFDAAKDWKLHKTIIQSGYMSYPAALLELFRDESEEPEGEVLKGETAVGHVNTGSSYPRISTLSLKEMQQFMKHEKCYKKTRSISELQHWQYNDYKGYKAQQSKVLKEQEEYQAHLYKLSMNSISKYNHIDSEASIWVKRCMNAAVKLTQKYQQHYVQLKEFGISVVPFKNDPVPSPIQNLTVSLGSQKYLSSVKFPAKIPNPINQNPKLKKCEKEYCWKKGVVSRDGNALKLAIAWNADIVISLGSLQTLADNISPFQNEWEVPIVVRTYEGLEYDRKRKIAFIDKPLPPKRIAPRERNWRYFKEVFKSLSEVPNVWGRIFTSEPVIDSEKGSNNTEKSRGTREKDNGQYDDLIMQVDGANDEKTSNKNSTQPQKKKSLAGTNKASTTNESSRKTQSFMSITNMWMQPHDDSSLDPCKSSNVGLVGESLSLNESSFEAFQPFIGRKSVSSLLQTQKSKDSKKDSMQELKKVGNSKAQEKKFEGLFFGVLPDSALCSSQDEAKSSKEMKSGDTEKTRALRPRKMSSSRDEAKSSKEMSGDTKKTRALRPCKMSSSPDEAKSSKEMSGDTKKNRALRSRKMSSSPDEAKSSKEMSGDTKKIKASRPCKITRKEIKPEPVDEATVRFTPRRSTRKKNDDSSPDLSNSAVSMFEKARSRARGRKMVTSTPTVKTKPMVRLIECDLSSDNEILGQSKAHQESSQPLEQDKETNETKIVESNDMEVANTSDLIEKILPKSDMSKSQKKNNDISKMKPFIPSSDLLGQILGKHAPSKHSLEDVTSAWAADAKIMSKADSDSKYSITDLGLQEPVPGKNVSYTLWKFGKKRVLIRYTLHGSLLTPILGRHEKEFQDPQCRKCSDVSLRTKLEYQSNFVFERMTISEMCRDWLTMLVKRPSKIVRARINPHSREILDIEWTMTLNHLNDKAEKIGYNSAVPSKLLTKLLDMIGDLDNGTYICCHREEENKVIIRQAVGNTSKKVVYDLYKEYSSPGREVYYSSSVPWVPGDSQKPRKFHTESGRIPMTFDPKDDQDSEKQAAGNKSNKRKKK